MQIDPKVRFKREDGIGACADIAEVAKLMRSALNAEPTFNTGRSYWNDGGTSRRDFEPLSASRGLQDQAVGG